MKGAEGDLSSRRLQRLVDEDLTALRPEEMALGKDIGELQRRLFRRQCATCQGRLQYR